MATTYPTTKQTFTDPNAADTLDSPSHAGLHTDKNDTIEALEDKVGTGAADNAPALNKFLRGTGANTSEWDIDLKDEDDMVSNSAVAVATQQSIKAYIEAERLRSKILSATRDLAAAAGDVAYTGVGFEPSSISLIASVDGAFYPHSNGSADSSGSELCTYLASDSSYYSNNTALCLATTAAGVYQNAVLKTYDSDGFTLTWGKAGSPTGTVNLRFICLR